MTDDEECKSARGESAFSVTPIFVVLFIVGLIVILALPNPVPPERIIFYQLFGGLALAIVGGTVAGWGIAAFIGSPSGTTSVADKPAPRGGDQGTTPKSTAPGGAPTEQPRGTPTWVRALAP